MTPLLLQKPGLLFFTKNTLMVLIFAGINFRESRSHKKLYFTGIYHWCFDMTKFPITLSIVFTVKLPSGCNSPRFCINIMLGFEYPKQNGKYLWPDKRCIILTSAIKSAFEYSRAPMTFTTAVSNTKVFNGGQMDFTKCTS